SVGAVSPSVRTFGKYLLDEEIARGGMSRVYSARLRGLGGFEKKLVVKQVLPELASDPRFVSMFVHEAKTLVQMSHPHIAPVFELGVVDGVYFLAMEYVEGATLAAILRDGPLAPGMVAHLGAEVCDALHYAHSRFGIVHRDVTPRNVIVDAAGHSRLLDFGIAAPVADADAEIFGTPGYLSPEQLEGAPVGPASDVFSLGAVLFEALTGRSAFAARTLEEARAAFERSGPNFEADEDVPEALGGIVLRALARDPKERFASARELGRALRGWLASAHPEGVAPELGLRAERAERKERRRLSLEPSAPVPRTPATREMRTIATSQALEALLAPASHPELDSGTVPIEGRARARHGEEHGRERDGEAGRDAEPEREHGVEREREPEPDRDREGGAGRDAETEPGGRPAPEPASAAEREREPELGGAVPAGSRSRSSRTIVLPGAVAAALLGTLGLALWRPADDEVARADPEPVAQPRIEPPPIEPVRSPEAAEARAELDPEPSAPEAPVEDPPPAPEPAPSRAASVPLTVSAMPWGELTLDGRAMGQLPLRGHLVRPGRHTVVVRNPPLGREVRYTFEAVAGQPVRLHADLSTATPTVRWIR
ncbi:MAG TPA: protein kinase, partial [Sandaracinaceae bacterium]